MRAAPEILAAAGIEPAAERLVAEGILVPAGIQPEAEMLVPAGTEPAAEVYEGISVVIPPAPDLRGYDFLLPGSEDPYRTRAERLRGYDSDLDEMIISGAMHQSLVPGPQWTDGGALFFPTRPGPPARDAPVTGATPRPGRQTLARRSH
jgi:hypothetical protein